MAVRERQWRRGRDVSGERGERLVELSGWELGWREGGR